MKNLNSAPLVAAQSRPPKAAEVPSGLETLPDDVLEAVQTAVAEAAELAEAECPLPDVEPASNDDLDY